MSQLQTNAGNNSYPACSLYRIEAEQFSAQLFKELNDLIQPEDEQKVKACIRRVLGSFCATEQENLLVKFVRNENVYLSEALDLTFRIAVFESPEDIGRPEKEALNLVYDLIQILSGNLHQVKPYIDGQRLNS